MRNLLGFIPAAHPTPASSSGPTRGSATPPLSIAEVRSLASQPSPSLLRRKPGSIGRSTRRKASAMLLGRREAETRDTILIPALSTSPILSPTNPLLWTQAQRTFGRVWFGFLAGRRREGPKRTDGRTRSQAFHVVPGKPGGAPRMSPATVSSRQTPARDAAISLKSRMRGAMIASYTKNFSAERSSPHAVYLNSKPRSFDRRRFPHAQKERPPHPDLRSDLSPKGEVRMLQAPGSTSPLGERSARSDG
jgi:hypothetical protein